MGSPQKEKNMKFGEVLDYRDTEEAKAFIGKKGVFSNNLCLIEENPKHCDTLILKEIEGGSTYPFTGGPDDIYQFFRPILEDEDLMTHEELAEWEARGFGLHSYNNKGSFWSTSNSYTEEERKKKVRETLVIRYFGSDEILKPTRAIFLKDCRKDN